MSHVSIEVCSKNKFCFNGKSVWTEYLECLEVYVHEIVDLLIIDYPNIFKLLIIDYPNILNY